MPAYIFLAVALVLNLRSDTPQADGRPVVIASFATSIEDQDEAVRHNIRLACAKLDGGVIPPKSVFSFNDTVGEGSVRNGYRNGAVCYATRFAMCPGGCARSPRRFLRLARRRLYDRRTAPAFPAGHIRSARPGRHHQIREERPTHAKPVRPEALHRRDRGRKEPGDTCTGRSPSSLPVRAGRRGGGSGPSHRGRRPPVCWRNKRRVYRKEIRGETFIGQFLLYRDYYPAVYLNDARPALVLALFAPLQTPAGRSAQQWAAFARGNGAAH